MNKEQWPPVTPKNIIVRMPNWLGDLVMATPVLGDLRRYYPDAEITVMCQDNVAPLLEKHPYVDEIFAFKRPSGWIHRVHHGVVIDRLGKGGYDLGILLTNSLSSAWLFWRGGVSNRLGYVGHWRSAILDRAVPYPSKIESQHLVITYKQVLRVLGVPLSDRAPRLYITDEELGEVRSLLGRYGIKDEHIVVGINPGAAYGSAKCWLPNRFKQVTERLLENPLVRVVYFGDHSGASLVDDICLSMSDRVVNLAGKTSLREFVALIQNCTIFLTNDSGPMHIASAVGTPLVALFGSTSAVKTGPYQGGTVIHKHVSCSPCYQRVCSKDFACMKQIEVDEVYEALQKILRE